MTTVVLLLLLGGLLGHVAVTVTALNVMYGQGWAPRAMLRGVRVLHDGWILLGTPWLAWICFQSRVWITGDWGSLPPALSAYVWCCAVTGWIIVPAAWLARRLRRPPAAQLSNHGRVIDIAARLERPPIGRGPHRLMAHWPWNEQFQLEVLERTFRMPRVPAAWDGLSILHISDLHFTGTVAQEYFAEVLREADGLDCDIVVFTGDLVDRPECYDWIMPLLGRLRHRFGAFAVLGNHDSWYDAARIRGDLAAAGFQLPAAQCTLVDVHGYPLLVAATEYPWMGRLPSLTDAPSDGFRMLLSHTPDNAPWASRQGFDLMVTGHNHGGQVRLPVVGPVFMPSRYGRKYDMGAFQVGPTLMHVSRGVSGKHPYRFGCMPEVTRLVLRPATGPVPVV